MTHLFPPYPFDIIMGICILGYMVWKARKDMKNARNSPASWTGGELVQRCKNDRP